MQWRTKKQELETSRLILRRWVKADAAELYKYAQDERVGPIAGWPAHTSVENSQEIIKDVLSADYTYAVVLKETGLPVGSIGIMIGAKSNFALPKNEAEIGYWVGVPYWGQGLIPEATEEAIRFAFEDLKMEKLWCGYFDGNEKSRRVQEKCGFSYSRTYKDMPCPLMGETRIEHVTCLTKAEWLSKKNEKGN